MPNLITLREGGSHASLTARTIDYPATSPSHASMLTGVKRLGRRPDTGDIAVAVPMRMEAP